MTSLRFEAILSPFIYRDVWQAGRCETSVEDFFEETFKLVSQLRNSILFIIPAEIIAYLHGSPRLKILLASLEDDTQSNIFILKNRREPICSVDNVSFHFNSGDLAIDEWVIHRKIVNAIFRRKNPILFDRLPRDDFKLQCDGCDDSSILCTFSFEFTPFVPGNSEDLREHIVRNQGYLLDFVKGTHVPSAGMVRYTSFLCAYFMSAPDQIIRRIPEMEFSKEFLHDLKDIPESDFKDLCYCVFRACFFPSIHSPMKDTKFSVDFHLNSPSFIHGTELHRMDVVPMHRTGRGGSGTKRVLIGSRNGRKSFLAYVDDHDFTGGLISSRVKLYYEP